MSENLRVRFLSIPAPIRAGTDVQFGAQVINDGDEATPDGTDFLVDFVIGNDRFSQTISRSIAPGEEFLVRAPGRWAAERGEHTLKVEADPEGNLTEDDTSDNTKEANFLVSAAESETDPGADEGPQSKPLEVVTVEILDEDVPARIVGAANVASTEGDVTSSVSDNPVFVFPLWQSTDTAAGIELSDKSTRGGSPVSERRRDFPDTFSVDIKVKKINPVTKNQPQRILQDTEVSRQAQAIFEAEGARVRITSTKHGRTVTGLVRRVRLQDSRDFPDSAIMNIDVREDPSAGGGPTFSLADLVVSTEGTDNEVGDAPELVPYWSSSDEDLARWNKRAENFAPTSPSKAGEQQCIRVSTRTQRAFDGVDDAVEAGARNYERAQEKTGVNLPGFEDIAAPIVFKAALVGSLAHATGSVLSDFGSGTAQVTRDLSPSGVQRRWLNLGRVERKDGELTDRGVSDPGTAVGPVESFVRQDRVQAAKQELLDLIEDRRPSRFPVRGRDYRIVGEGDNREIEVSGEALAKLLPGKSTVRCE